MRLAVSSGQQMKYKQCYSLTSRLIKFQKDDVLFFTSSLRTCFNPKGAHLTKAVYL